MTRLLLTHDHLSGRPKADSPGMGGTGASRPDPNQPDPNQPDLERARRWRFERSDDGPTRLRQPGPHDDIPEATPGSAIVPRGTGWDERTGGPAGFDVLGFLWRRKRRIGLVAAALMASLTIVTVLVPKTFIASSTVIYQGDAPLASREADAREPAFAADTLSNEVELMTSEQLLASVVVKLGLSNDREFAPGVISALPAWADPWVARAQGAATAMLAKLGVRPTPTITPKQALVQTVEALRARLSIAPVGLSRVVRITAKAHEPALAARMADSVAEAYVDARANERAVATRAAHEWFENRLGLLRDRALAAARAFDAFRHDNGAVRGKDGPIGQEQLTQVSSELSQVRQQQSTVQSALADATGTGEADLDALASASGSPLLPKLREQLATAMARRAELETTGGSALPSVVASRALVADVARSIARERTRIRATLQAKAVVLSATEKRLAALLGTLTAKVERADGSGAQMSALDREAQASAELYRSFVVHAEQTDPELNYQAPGVRILSHAVPPTRAASPNKRVILPGALVLSLGLGVALALVRETGRRGVTSLRDVPRPRGQPPLGLLPFMRRGDRKMMRVWHEAVAQVLARMLLPFRGIVPNSILVTSALPQEGKTRVAIALAMAAHDRGMRVLLVDADLRRRGVSRAAGLLKSRTDLVQLLMGEISVDEAAVEHADWGFSVLPAGQWADSPVNLLAGEAWEIALRDLEGLFDLVVIDTPPVLAAADAWLLARHVDATALVAESGRTEAAMIEQAVEQLTSAQARVLGLVLTKVVHADQTGSGDAVMFSPGLLHYHNQRRLR